MEDDQTLMLYEKARQIWGEVTRPEARQALRDVVDMVLEEQKTSREPWDVLREASNILRFHGGAFSPARSLAVTVGDWADDLEAEHRAAQVEADLVAERESLVYQAMDILAPLGMGSAHTQASALVEAGWRPAPKELEEQDKVIT